VFACIIHQFGRAVGEATILGYIKAIPQETVITFGTGSGVAVFYQIFTTILLNELGLWENFSFLILALMVIPLFAFFAWVEDHRLFHKQFRNVF
jgi:hypothetical protein